MCGTCGCGEHHHHHDHTHEHSHGHEHHHHPDEGIVINLEQDILQRNNLLAERNRGYFEAKNLFCLNLMSSPGSGKTTLIKILNGLLKPTGGHVYYNGADIHDADYNRKELRSRVGLVFQYPEYQLFEETILKDIAFGPKNLGFDKKKCDCQKYG